jgi:hypothetical protein
MSERDNFVRIAMAIIKRDYPFRPQRLAVASKMYSRWVERNKMQIDTNEQIINKWNNKSEVH